MRDAGELMPRKIAGPCTVKWCGEAGIHRGRCDEHKLTTSQRDYGKDHQAERREWQRRIDSGESVLCRRCKQPIPPFNPSAWDLGHPTPKAPECRRHNRATMGRDRA